MIIFLYGPDSYRRSLKLNEIVRVFREKYTSPAIEKFDLSEEENFEKLRDFGVGQSMFEPVKLAITENIFSPTKKVDPKTVAKFLKNNLENKELIILTSEDKPPLTAFKFLLEKPVQSQQFTNLTGEKIRFFLEKETEARNLKLDSQTQKILLEAYGEDSWGLITELDRLALMEKPVVETTILSSNYFQLVNALKSKNKTTAEKLPALEKILSEHHEDPARVFNSLAYKTNSPEEGERLADYDVAVKSGKLDYEEVLVDLAIN